MVKLPGGSPERRKFLLCHIFHIKFSQRELLKNSMTFGIERAPTFQAYDFQGLLSSQARGESPGQCSLDNCAGDELIEKLVNPENILLGGTDEETLIRNLIDWQQGFLSNKIEIRRGEYGVGVYALENLEENEELFTSNNEYIIKLDRALKVILA